MLQFLRHGSLSCCVGICVQVLHGTCVCRVHVVRLLPEMQVLCTISAQHLCVLVLVLCLCWCRVFVCVHDCYGACCTTCHTCVLSCLGLHVAWHVCVPAFQWVHSCAHWCA